MKSWLVLLHIAYSGGDIDLLENYQDHFTVIGPLPPNWKPNIDIKNVAEVGVFEARTAYEAASKAAKAWGNEQALQNISARVY